MANVFETTSLEPSLRRLAEQRLACGVARHAQETTLGADALRALYRLESSSASAAEGLKLLHELQTLQVELDLQNDQLATSAYLNEKLGSYYHSLFCDAPLGYVVTSLDGRIEDSNSVAAELFQRTPDRMQGNSLLGLLNPAERAMAAAKLRQVRESGTSLSWVAPAACTAPAGARGLQFHARMAKGGQQLLIQITDIQPESNA
jgi:PAS domain-containing protein